MYPAKLTNTSKTKLKRIKKVVKLNNSQAIVRGPLLFARDSRFNDGDIDECATIKCNNQGVIQAKIKKNKTGTFPWITLTVPAVLGTDLENVENKTPKLINFCDFSSSGNDWNPNGRYRVWIPQKVLNMIAWLEGEPAITEY